MQNDSPEALSIH